MKWTPIIFYVVFEFDVRVYLEVRGTIVDNLPKFEDRMSEDTKMALIYIAGYIVRNYYIEDMFKYHKKYGVFVNDLNRGGLTIPGDSVCQWSFYCYVYVP